MVRKNQSPPLGKDLGTFKQLFLTTEDPSSNKKEGKKRQGRSPPATGGSDRRRKQGKAPCPPADKIYLDGVPSTPPPGVCPIPFISPLPRLILCWLFLHRQKQPCEAEASALSM